MSTRVFKDDTIIERDAIHINCDPDRLDVFDLTSALAPVLIKVAYVHLAQDRAKHERKRERDTELEPFNFTEEALLERVQEIAMTLGKMLIAQEENRLTLYVPEVQSSFPTPLDPVTTG